MDNKNLFGVKQDLWMWIGIAIAGGILVADLAFNIFR